MSVNEKGKIKTPFQKQLYACRHVLIPSIISGILKVRESKNNAAYISTFGEVLCAAAPVVADTCGIFACAFFMHYNGRRRCAIFINVIFMIPPMIYVFDPGVEIDFAAIIVYCVSRKFLTIAANILVAEMAEPRWRAVLLGTCFLGYNCGHGVFWYVPVNSLIAPVFSLFLITTSMLLSLRSVETPYWVAVNGRNEEAKELFFYLRGARGDKDELEDMLDATVIDAIKKKLGILRNVYTKRFITPCFVIGFMTLGTANTCYLYNDLTNTLLHSYKFVISPFDKVLIKSIIHFVSQLFANVVFCILAMNTRRRDMYALTVYMHAVALLLTTLAPLGLPYFIYLNLTCSFFDNLGSRPVTRLLSTEIFPAVVREFGAASEAVIDHIFGVIRTYLPRRGPIVYNKFSVQFFWGTIPVGVLFTYFFMPETKNAPLTETERLARNFNEILHRKGFYEEDPGD